jgi:acetyl-CoA carboxylase biotin carboxyl carrier protein
MDVDKIFSLIDKAEASSFDRIEIQTQDVRLCLERNRQGDAAAPAASAPAREAAAAKEFATEDIIFAPISGVFYAAREPGAEPYVREGQTVLKGEPVCIIEAMKMMNEIGAPKTGVIERIFIANAQAISEGDALFLYAKEV